MPIALLETKSTYITLGFDPKLPVPESKVPPTAENSAKFFLWQQKTKNKQKKRIGHKPLYIHFGKEAMAWEDPDETLAYLYHQWWHHLFNSQEKAIFEKEIIQYETELRAWQEKVLNKLRQESAKQLEVLLSSLTVTVPERDDFFMAQEECIKLANLALHNGLKSPADCYRLHKKLYKLDKTISKLSCCKKSEALQEALELFTIANQSYLDWALLYAYPKSRAEKIADIFMLICVAVAIAGAIGFLITSNTLFIILASAGAFLLLRELFYLARDAYYHLAPTYMNVIKIITASLILSAVVIGPFIGTLIDLNMEIIDAWRFIGHIILASVKSLAFLVGSIALIAVPLLVVHTQQAPKKHERNSEITQSPKSFWDYLLSPFKKIFVKDVPKKTDKPTGEPSAPDKHNATLAR